jgi:hypothetical protein
MVEGERSAGVSVQLGLSRAQIKGLEVGDECLLFDDTKLRREEPGSSRSEYLRQMPLAAASCNLY